MINPVGDLGIPDVRSFVRPRNDAEVVDAFFRIYNRGFKPNNIIETADGSDCMYLEDVIMYMLSRLYALEGSNSIVPEMAETNMPEQDEAETQRIKNTIVADREIHDALTTKSLGGFLGQVKLKTP
jgi:hypothetical protein